MKIELYNRILDTLKELIKESPFENNVYAVGGCVRDSILGNDIKDIDLVVSLPNGGIELANWLFAKGYLKGSIVKYERFGTAMFQLMEYPDIELESVMTRCEQYVSDSRKPETSLGTIFQDCERRDLTINALYYNISTGEINDVSGKGLDDIKNKVLRTPNDPDVTYTDDPLRILRCVRFYTKYLWKIDEDVLTALKRNIGRLNIISRERIADELSKILLSDNAYLGISVLQEIGAFKYIFADNSSEDHVIYNNIKSLEDNFVSITDALKKHCYSDEDIEIKLTERLAILMYKSENFKILLQTLKFSNAIINRVSDILTYSYELIEQYKNSPLDVGYIRFLQHNCGRKELVNSIYSYIFAVESNSLGENILKLDKDAGDVMYTYKLPFNGNDLMEHFNLKPSPIIKDLIDLAWVIVSYDPNITTDNLLLNLKTHIIDGTRF